MVRDATLGRRTPQYLSSICQNLPSTTLRSLELNFDTPHSPETFPPCALSTIVEAMRPLSHLTAVALHLGPKLLVLVGDGMRLLGELCPRLRSFKVTQYEGALDRARSVTLSGLVKIAHACPALQSLSLPRLDAAGQFSEASIPDMSHGLRFLEFEEVDGVSDPSLARVIARIFPQLQFNLRPESIENSVASAGRRNWTRVVRAILNEL